MAEYKILKDHPLVTLAECYKAKAPTFGTFLISRRARLAIAKKVRRAGGTAPAGKLSRTNCNTIRIAANFNIRSDYAQHKFSYRTCHNVAEWIRKDVRWVISDDWTADANAVETPSLFSEAPARERKQIAFDVNEAEADFDRRGMTHKEIYRLGVEAIKGAGAPAEPAVPITLADKREAQADRWLALASDPRLDGASQATREAFADMVVVTGYKEEDAMALFAERCKTCRDCESCGGIGYVVRGA